MYASDLSVSGPQDRMTMDSPLSILGIGGSLNRSSRSQVALKTALEFVYGSGIQTAEVDLRQISLPFFSLQQPKTDTIAAFLEQVNNADGIIIASPEYHGCFSGVLKNALDYLSKDEMGAKPVGLISVCGGNHGGTGTLNTLGTVLQSLHGIVLPFQVVISHSSHKISETGEILDSAIEERLSILAAQMVNYTMRFQTRVA